ncbi:MAG: hypothetical protein II989_04605 [Bacteroidales bacterium]|nr:hypothetical protein [Bacteroidales bacterium]MBQ3613353.1 hypothetical protein [Bacteroidales bacterium]
MKTTTKLCLIWLIWILTTPFLLLTTAGSIAKGNLIISVISAASLLATTAYVIMLHKKLFRIMKKKD